VRGGYRVALAASAYYVSPTIDRLTSHSVKVRLLLDAYAKVHVNKPHIL
jgi:hypothetical protein